MRAWLAVICIGGAVAITGCGDDSAGSADGGGGTGGTGGGGGAGGGAGGGGGGTGGGGGSGKFEAEKDNGPVEASLADAKKAAFPGMPVAGKRVIRVNNGFFDGDLSSYYMIGPAPRWTAQIWMFCRTGDTACPLDAKQRVDPTKMVGDPVIDSIPGDEKYSPFWEMVVVRVPADYPANAMKSATGIDAQVKAGVFKTENLIVDFGGSIGKKAAIFNCPVVLAGTECENNGADIAGKPGQKSILVPSRTAWYRGWKTTYFDFSVSEGAFPVVVGAAGKNEIPVAPIWLPHRNCAATPTPAICGTTKTGFMPVFEQELGGATGTKVDLNADGDDLDNNNVIAAFPGRAPKDPADKPYSPLWEIMMAPVAKDRDAAVKLLDTAASPAEIQVKSIADLRARQKAGDFEADFPNVPEAVKGVMIPGNGGKLMVNCPSQVPAP